MMEEIFAPTTRYRDLYGYNIENADPQDTLPLAFTVTKSYSPLYVRSFSRKNARGKTVALLLGAVWCGWAPLPL
jgi:hypothetical protein